MVLTFKQTNKRTIDCCSGIIGKKERKKEIIEGTDEHASYLKLLVSTTERRRTADSLHPGG